ALAKAPVRRYATARELDEDLQRFLNGDMILARPASWYERSWKWACRRPALASLLAIIILITGVGFPSVLWLWRQAEEARAVAANKSVAEAAAAAKALAEQQRAEAAKEEAYRSTLKGYQQAADAQIALARLLRHVPSYDAQQDALVQIRQAASLRQQS